MSECLRTTGPRAACIVHADRARKGGLWLACSILWSVALACGGAPLAHAASLLDSLLGSWSGSGQIRYDDGQSERIRCSAFYTGSAQAFKLAIRCRSDSTEIEIRGQLMAQGDAVSGTWEERTFNASGEASGRLTGDKLNLSVSGGGFSGSMSVAQSGGRQVVTISTEGIRMRSVTVTLSKG
jgi:hypothetical protein